jgi:hypothetical protein
LFLVSFWEQLLGAVVAVIYGSWIYNYIYNQCISPLMLWVRISIRARCTTLCDKVCQWLATSRWFSPGPPVSSTNKIEILFKVALNTIKQINIVHPTHEKNLYFFNCWLIYQAYDIFIIVDPQLESCILFYILYSLKLGTPLQYNLVSFLNIWAVLKRTFFICHSGQNHVFFFSIRVLSFLRVS